jgi:hypothetical protein
MSTNPAGDRDRLAEFLSRYRVGGQPVTDTEVRAEADRILDETNIPGAELAARGYRHLTVVRRRFST